MGPGVVKLVAVLAQAAVSVDDGTDERGRDYLRATVLGIPVFDTRWEGVRRRRARRDARRDKR